MQRVLSLVVVAGLAMCLPTAVYGDDMRTGSMEGVSCGSDGIESTGCISGFQGGRGNSGVSNFLNTYVDIHFGDKT